MSWQDLEQEGGFIIAAGPALLGKEDLGTLPGSQCTLAGRGPAAWVCVCLILTSGH